MSSGKYIPPHMRNQEKEDDSGGGLASLRSGESGKYVPPHLRNAGGDRDKGSDERGSGGGGYPAGRTAGSRPAGSDRDRGGFSNGRDHDSGGFGGGGGNAGSSRFDCLKEPTPSRSGGGWGGRDGGRDGGRGGGGFGGSRWDDRESEYEVFGDLKKIAENSDAIDFEQYDKIPVSVTGRGSQQILEEVLDSFKDAQLSEALLENIERCGYQRPTPIQKHVILVAMGGRDIMACAQTGSGKTCAFMVPAVDLVLRYGTVQGPKENGYSERRKPTPSALILAPTRELASQIQQEGRKFAFRSGVRACVVYGGADMREQRRDLQNGCGVLVATPGRLQDMLERGYVSLGGVSCLILDEADRMLDMGFEPQVRQIVEKSDMGSLLQDCDRQSMMFSATFPREVQFLARDFLRDYIFVTVGRVGSASELVEQKVVYADDRDKMDTLFDILEDFIGGTEKSSNKERLVLIFVETKRGCDHLDQDLSRHKNSNYRSTAIHGDRSQRDREDALHMFRSGRTPILVATDVAARGLDIPNVELVINYDMPKTIDDYVHRIGRTGRAGKHGMSIGFVNDKCTRSFLQELHELLDEAGQEIPDFFEKLAGQRSRFGGYGGGGNRKGKGKGKGGKPRFGARDHRFEDHGDRGRDRDPDRW